MCSYVTCIHIFVCMYVLYPLYPFLCMHFLCVPLICVWYLYGAQAAEKARACQQVERAKMHVLAAEEGEVEEVEAALLRRLDSMIVKGDEARCWEWVAVGWSGLQWVAVGCRVVQCVAVCCCVLWCVAAVLWKATKLGSESGLRWVEVGCSGLQRVVKWCSVLQCGVVCCSVVKGDEVSKFTEYRCQEIHMQIDIVNVCEWVSVHTYCVLCQRRRHQVHRVLM